jgi:hypothetical protein
MERHVVAFDVLVNHLEQGASFMTLLRLIDSQGGYERPEAVSTISGKCREARRLRCSASLLLASGYFQ